MKMRIPILMYHYVRPTKERISEKHKVLDLNLFISQLKILQDNYQFVISDQIIEGPNLLKGGKKKVWLTFDDGYRDCVDYVLPSLLEVGGVGSFYIPTEAVFFRKLLDVNKIQILLATGKSTDEILRITKEIFDELKISQILESSFDDLFRKNGVANERNDRETEFLKKLLQKLLPIRERKNLLNLLFCQLVDRKESSWVDEFYLTPDDVRKLAESGMEIGSHSHSHEWLCELSVSEQRHDLKTSFSILDTELRCSKAKSFCYPFGAFNESTINILNELDVRTAVVNKGKKFADVIPERSAMLELSRIDIMFFDQFIRGDFS